VSLYTRLVAQHAVIYERTGGVLGHRLFVQPTILLQSIGRKSGLQRSLTLAYFVDDQHPETLLVVASNWGKDQPPAWLLNVTANSEVNVQLKRRNYPATATAIYPGEPEYDRLITLCDTNNRGRYSRYRSMTKRPIPVVALTPR